MCASAGAAGLGPTDFMGVDLCSNGRARSKINAITVFGCEVCHENVELIQFFISKTEFFHVWWYSILII